MIRGTAMGANRGVYTANLCSSGLSQNRYMSKMSWKKLDIAEVDSRSKEGPSWKDQKMLYWRVQQHPVRGRKPGARLNWQIAMRRTVRAHLDKKKEEKNVFSPVPSPV